MADACRLADGQPGARARARARRRVARRPRQDLRRAEPRRLRPLGRAAARRVDRQARQGLDPGAGRVTRRSRSTGARGARHRPVRARSGVLSLGVRDCRRRLDPRHQPVRPAGRPGGEGQDEADPRLRRGARRRTGGLGRGALHSGRARRLRGDPGVRGSDSCCSRATSSRSRSKRVRRRDASSRTASGLATCTRPGSCTRAVPRRASSCRSSTIPATSWRSRSSRSASRS